MLPRSKGFWGFLAFASRKLLGAPEGLLGAPRKLLGSPWVLLGGLLGAPRGPGGGSQDAPGGGPGGGPGAGMFLDAPGGVLGESWGGPGRYREGPGVTGKGQGGRPGAQKQGHGGVKFCPRAGLCRRFWGTCGDLSGTSKGPLGDVCGTSGGPQPRRSPAAATSGQACHRFVLNWDRRAEFCPRLLPLRDLCATSARPLQDLCATSARHCATSAGPLARPLRDLCATSGVVPPFV